jgi:hypothetical protein
MSDIRDQTKVSNLARQFESFSIKLNNEVTETKKKPPKPPIKPNKNIPIRNQSMRDSLLLDHRKGVVLRNPKNLLSENRQSLDSDDSFENLYENVEENLINNEHMKWVYLISKFDYNTKKKIPHICFSISPSTSDEIIYANFNSQSSSANIDFKNKLSEALNSRKFETQTSCESPSRKSFLSRELKLKLDEIHLRKKAQKKPTGKNHEENYYESIENISEKNISPINSRQSIRNELAKSSHFILSIGNNLANLTSEKSIGSPKKYDENNELILEIGTVTRRKLSQFNDSSGSGGRNSAESSRSSYGYCDTLEAPRWADFGSFLYFY